jgi:hypothetical protein
VVSLPVFLIEFLVMQRVGPAKLRSLAVIMSTIRTRHDLNLARAIKVVKETRKSKPNTVLINRKLDQVIEQAAIIRRELSRYHHQGDEILDELGI